MEQATEAQGANKHRFMGSNADVSTDVLGGPELPGEIRAEDIKSSPMVGSITEGKIEAVTAYNAPAVDSAALSPAQMRDLILNAGGASGPEIRKVHIPFSWNIDVYIRGMTARQRDTWEAEQVKVGKNGKVEYTQDNIRASLVARVLCDVNGTPVMKQEDVERLGRKDSAPIDMIYDIGKEMSGISKKDEAELQSALKNDRSGDGW